MSENVFSGGGGGITQSFAVLLFDQSEELVIFFNGCKDLPANILISGMLMKNNRLI